MSLSKPLICQGCWQQMRVPVPIRGPLAVPLRMVGIRRSGMNPNICTICELTPSKVIAQIPVGKLAPVWNDTPPITLPSPSVSTWNGAPATEPSGSVM